jgi:hypothetical protein
MKTVLISVIALLAAFVMYQYWRSFPDPTNLESLFAGWAFIGLIATVILQGIELRLQRKELTESRGVALRAAEAQEKSETSLASQINSMNTAALVQSYSSILDYYDRVNPSNTDKDLAKHALSRLKQLVDHLEKTQGWTVQRPVDWNP